MTPNSIAPVFRVADIEAALAYYTDTLGFTKDFVFGNYAGLKFGAALLHITSGDNYQRLLGGGTAYLFCDEVDAYAAAIKAKGAHLACDPADQPYQMRDFTVIDPDGNHLHFGCPICQ